MWLLSKIAYHSIETCKLVVESKFLHNIGKFLSSRGDKEESLRFLCVMSLSIFCCLKEGQIVHLEDFADLTECWISCLAMGDDHLIVPTLTAMCQFTSLGEKYAMWLRERGNKNLIKHLTKLIGSENPNVHSSALLVSGNLCVDSNL